MDSDAASPSWTFAVPSELKNADFCSFFNLFQHQLDEIRRVIGELIHQKGWANLIWSAARKQLEDKEFLSEVHNHLQSRRIDLTDETNYGVWKMHPSRVRPQNFEQVYREVECALMKNSHNQVRRRVRRTISPEVELPVVQSRQSYARKRNFDELSTPSDDDHGEETVPSSDSRANTDNSGNHFNKSHGNYIRQRTITSSELDEIIPTSPQKVDRQTLKNRNQSHQAPSMDSSRLRRDQNRESETLPKTIAHISKAPSSTRIQSISRHSSEAQSRSIVNQESLPENAARDPHHVVRQTVKTTKLPVRSPPTTVSVTKSHEPAPLSQVVFRVNYDNTTSINLDHYMFMSSEIALTDGKPHEASDLSYDAFLARVNPKGVFEPANGDKLFFTLRCGKSGEETFDTEIRNESEFKVCVQRRWQMDPHACIEILFTKKSVHVRR